MNRHLRCFSLSLLSSLLGVWGCADQRSNEELFRHAAEELKQGKHAEAEAAITTVLERDSHHPMGHMLKAELNRAKGDFEGALSEFMQVPVNSQPGCTARLEAGLIAMQMHRAQQAENLWSGAQELDSKYVPLAESLLQLYALQRRREDIAEQLEIIREQRPLALTEALLESTSGTSLFATKQAISILELQVATDSGDDKNALALAKFYIESDRTVDAIALLQKTLTKSPEAMPIRGLLARLLCHADSKSAEIDEVLAPVTFDNDTPFDVWLGSGCVDASREKFDTAVINIAEAIKRDPTDRFGWQTLLDVLKRSQQNDWNAAIETQLILIKRLQTELDAVTESIQTKQSPIKVAQQVVATYLVMHDERRAKVWMSILKDSPADDDWKTAMESRAAETPQQLLARVQARMRRRKPAPSN